MRDYGKVHTSFWASETLSDLDSDAKLLALYLLTSPHTTLSGAFRLPDAYACEDLKWHTERLQNGFLTLSAAGFIEHCAATSWVWICKFGEWNKPDNPNIRKAVIKSVCAIPAAVSFKEKIAAYWGVSETVAKPLGNPPSPSPSPFPLLILDDETDFEVSETFATELRIAYPRIDLLAELAKMRVWLLANKAQRKTRKGTPRFINSWLSKATPTPTASAPKRRKQLGEGSSTNYGDRT
jgi:hypothetical protein